jgi:hypothetical protein
MQNRTEASFTISCPDRSDKKTSGNQVQQESAGDAQIESKCDLGNKSEQERKPNQGRDSLLITMAWRRLTCHG